jgi:voltage-gated potassium channel
MKNSNLNSKQPSIINVSIMRLFLAGLSIVGIGTFFYHYIEKLSYIDSLYFSVITLTTIGYGDIYPKTSIGKLFTVIYVLVGISLLAGIANYIVKRAVVKRIEDKRKARKQ